MYIYFLRHANAGVPKANAAKDEKRPLDERGIKQGHDVGRALAAMNVTLDVIVSSPLLRALQTAEIVAREMRHRSKVVTDAALRPGASYEEFQQLLDRHSRTEAIMVVGHNPNLSQFLNKLLPGGNGATPIELKKGSIAKVEKEGRNPAILKWYMTPKVVSAIQHGSATSARPKTVRK
jgi:phosphohistidine phosphatase